MPVIDEVDSEQSTSGLAACLADVRKSFEGVPVINGISFGVERGAVTGLVGGEGAGKTATLRLLAGLIVPDSGEITVADREPIDAHDRIVYAPSNPTIDPSERLALLAGALATPADLYLVDEPFIGLDDTQSSLAAGLLHLAAAYNSGVLVTSQELPRIERVCDQLVILKQGRVTWQGSMGDARTVADRRLLIDVRSGERWYEIDGVEVLKRQGDTVLIRLHPRVEMRTLVEASKRAGDLIRVGSFEGELDGLIAD